MLPPVSCAQTLARCASFRFSQSDQHAPTPFMNGGSKPRRHKLTQRDKRHKPKLRGPTDFRVSDDR